MALLDFFSTVTCFWRNIRQFKVVISFVFIHWFSVETYVVFPDKHLQLSHMLYFVVSRSLFGTRLHFALNEAQWTLSSKTNISPSLCLVTFIRKWSVRTDDIFCKDKMTTAKNPSKKGRKCVYFILLTIVRVLCSCVDCAFGCVRYWYLFHLLNNPITIRIKYAAYRKTDLMSKTISVFPPSSLFN
jgi:hypothetical protein